MHFFDSSMGRTFMDNVVVGVQNGMNYVEEAMGNLLSTDIQTEIASTPYETVYTEDRIKLKYYKSPVPDEEKRVKTPLLIVYALINRETMLDLQQDKSVIRNFLERGVDLYVLDWGYPSRKDRYLTLDDHVNGYINNVVEAIRTSRNIPAVNLMGICMGGTMSAIYSSFYPEKVKNLITTVTPISFDHDEGLLHVWMKHTDVDRLVDTWGNMPGDIMNMGFLMLNPARLMVEKYKNFAEHLNDQSYVENFIRMEKWIFDSPDVPGETFRQFIKDCYCNDLLVKKQMQVGKRIVDLENITMPVLNIYGRYDHLVPPASCEAFTGLVGSEDVKDICLDTGHIGIYVSSKSQKRFVPSICSWLGERDAVIKPSVANSPWKSTVVAGRKKSMGTKQAAKGELAGKKKTDAQRKKIDEGVEIHTKKSA